MRQRPKRLAPLRFLADSLLRGHGSSMIQRALLESLGRWQPGATYLDFSPDPGDLRVHDLSHDAGDNLHAEHAGHDCTSLSSLCDREYDLQTPGHATAHGVQQHVP